MQKNPKVPDDPAGLRRRAEARLRGQGKVKRSKAGAKTETDTARVLHELEVHQIELEMQNSELQEARDRMEVLLEKYTDLYDFAPVGYFTLAADGTIQLVNLTGAHLVGLERSRLVGLPFGRLVCAELRPVFQSFLKQVFAGQARQSGDFELLRQGQPLRIVNIEAQRLLNAPACRAVVVDITERKRAEDAQRRMDVLAASNQKLKREIVRRQTAEEALQKSERHLSKLLEQSSHMQKQLRHLSHQILHAQEEERKRISRELHDEIAQTLMGINVHLDALTHETADRPRGLKQKITRTQRLVEESVATVHRFARELRPTVLDDLGLIPALHSFMKEFVKRTGVHVRFTTFAGVEKLNSAQRTVLFRVAQEALTNVARHAQATKVKVRIQKLPGAVGMQIKDDGKSFKVEQTLRSRTNKNLGLLGIRERLEMVGGSFDIASAAGKGTTVRVQIPLHPVRAGAVADKIALKTNLESQ